MRKKLVSFTALLLAGLLSIAAPPASAQGKDRQGKALAKELFRKGKVQFDLGRFARAIEHFSKGYEAFDDPAFLFSIAQSYRQLDDCKNSIFFFKRYLSVKKDAPDKKSIQKRIEEIQDNCRQRVSIRDKPPTGASVTEPPDKDKRPPDDTATDPPDVPPDNTTVQTPPEGPGPGTTAAVVDTAPPVSHILALRAEVGTVVFGFRGDNNITPTVRAAILLGAAYPLRLGKNRLELGLLTSLSNIAHPVMGMVVTSKIATFMANGSLLIPLARGLTLRGELGFGVLIMYGLVEGNRFIIDQRAVQNGGLPMFHVRLAVSAEYALTSQWSLSLTPLSLGFSPPHAQFNSDITAVTQLGFVGGISYRF